MNEVYKIINDVPYIPIDRKTIPQEGLDLANKNRASIFPWRGQFSPELIELLLTYYAKPNSVILDPFAGSGTTLFESARKSLICYGAEINPAAIEMCRTVHFVNLSHSERENFINKARSIIDSSIPFLSKSNLFSFEDKKRINLTDAEIFKRMLQSSFENPFVYNIIINSIIRYFANSKITKTAKATKFVAAFNKHIEIIRSLPYSSKTCKIYPSDARNLTLSDNTIDLIITSPPYINVFNYHQYYRKAMEIAGWNLLEIAKSEIGSNRKNRGNRFLTVIQYSIDMMQSLLEMRRVLVPNGRIIIVIGRESRVRRVKFENYKILSALAIEGIGLKLVCRQERRFINRFGKKIFEDILHFVVDREPLPDPEDFARQVAICFLKRAKKNASGEVKKEIELAINNADNVAPSPLFEYKTRRYLKNEFNTP